LKADCIPNSEYTCHGSVCHTKNIAAGSKAVHSKPFL
jgi:hypothetical protein